MPSEEEAEITTPVSSLNCSSLEILSPPPTKKSSSDDKNSQNQVLVTSQQGNASNRTDCSADEKNGSRPVIDDVTAEIEVNDVKVLKGSTIDGGGCVTDIGSDDVAEATQQSLRHSVDDSSSSSRRRVWGGPYFRLIREHDDDFDEFAREENPFEGVREIFARESGRCRAIFWAIAFVGIGCCFFVMQIPDIRAYEEKQTTTSNSQITAFELTHPIVTVCPPGTGIRCDCQLWTRLACRYDFGREDQFFFRHYLCAVWSSWESRDKKLETVCSMVNVSDLSWNNDVCSSSSSGDDLPQGKDLYDRAIERERTTGAPFLTFEEVIAYGAARFNESTLSFRTRKTKYSVANVVDSQYVNYKHLDMGSGKVCTQLRFPLNQTQTSRGVDTGILVLATDTFSSFVATEVDAVLVHVDANYIPLPKRAEVITENLLTVSAGSITKLGLILEQSKLLHGYGDEASRTCITGGGGDSREICVYKHELMHVYQKCDRCVPTQYSDYFGVTDVQEYNALGCDFGCFDEFLNEVQVPIEICPFRCEENNTEIAGMVQGRQSNLYRNVLNSVINASKTVDLRIGYTTFAISTTERIPAKTLGALTGQIGGNMNLWFGPNVMTVIALLEMLTIGLLVTKFGRRRCC